MANDKQAISAYQKGLAIYQSVFNQAEGRSNDLDYIQEEASNTYQGLGISLLGLNQPEQSLVHLRECLALRVQYYGAKHTKTAEAYQTIGNFYLKYDHVDSALTHYQQALIASIASFNTNNPYEVPSTHLITKTSYSIPSIIADKALALQTWYDQQPNDTAALHAAYRYYCLTDTLLTQYRRTYSREISKLAFSEDNHILYERAFGCALSLYQQGKNIAYLNKAFQFMDKSKASLLLETIREQETLAQLGIPQKNYQQEQLLRKDAYYLQSKLDEENAQTEVDETVLQTLHTRLQANEKALAGIRKKYAGKHFYSIDTQSGVDTFTINYLSDFSKKKNAAILEYFWGDSSVFVIGIYRNTYQTWRINRDATLEHHLARYRACLNKGYVIASKDQDFADFGQSAYSLYQLLIKPVVGNLRINTTQSKNHSAIKLMIIPDGPLSVIPFEPLLTAAPTGNKIDYSRLPYLIHQFTISYGYSARLLMKETQPAKKTPTGNVLAFSYSQDEDLPSQTGKLGELRHELAELPGAAKEIQAIAAMMQGRFYMGEEATEERFKAEAPKFDIIHLAIHGEADSHSFYNSRLLFRLNKKALNDGVLQMHELLNIKLKAKLSVLSACESGVGKIGQGEGVYSIARGFVAAGCSAVVMSLWKANDLATANLMIRFYESLANGSSIDTSIREAKLQYLRQEKDIRNTHPAYWAAFVPVGDMQALQQDQKPILSPLTFFGSILVVGVLLYLVFRSKRNYS